MILVWFLRCKLLITREDIIAYEYEERTAEWVPSTSLIKEEKHMREGKKTRKKDMFKYGSSIIRSTKLPEEFIELLKVAVTPPVLEALYAALKKHEEHWLYEYVELGGLVLLFDIISLKHRKSK